MKELNKKELDVYAYIAGYTEDNGYSPLRREICDKMNISNQMVQRYIHKLLEKGWIRIVAGKSRNIELVG